MIFRRLLLLFFLLSPPSVLIAQKLLVIFPDTMESEARMRSRMAGNEGFRIYYRAMSTQRPVGSEDLLQIIRAVHSSDTIDYVLLAGPVAALPLAPTPFGEASDYLYSLPDSNGPALAVGRIPALNRAMLKLYFENRLSEKKAIDPSLVYLMHDPGDTQYIEKYRGISAKKRLHPFIIKSVATIRQRALALVFIGEGTPYAWPGSYTDRDDITKLHPYPSLIISIACSSASILDPQSMAYSFLFARNASRAFIGCIGYCLREEGALYGEYILNALDPNRPMGDIMKDAARAFLAKAPCKAENKILTVSGFVILGDPSLSPFENRLK